MGLAKKTISGIIWHFSQLLVRRSINLVVTLILARILVPEDFGLVAMMTVFLAIGSSLMNSGFKQALIRMQYATNLDFNTAFYSNLILGMLAYGVLFATAPLIAKFYNESKLIDLVRVAAIGVIINSFLVVQEAKIHRSLNFKAEMQAIFPAGILSGLLAIILAYEGLGVWVLVVQMLVFALINTTILWLKQGWRPSLIFNRQSFSEMYGFGYKLFITGVLDAVFKNIYVIVIAKLFNASVAGFYFFAEKVKDMVINQLISSIQTVTYSTLANMHDNDEKLKNGYRKIISITTFFIFPAMAIMAALAVPIFECMMPENWLFAAPYLQILCLAGLLDPVIHINSNLIKVKGRSDLYLYVEILKKTLVVVVLVVSVNYGIYAILIGQIVCSILTLILSIYCSSRLISYSVNEQVSDFLGNFVLSILVGGGAFVGSHYLYFEPLIELLMFGFISTGLYCFFAYLLKFNALVLVMEMVRNKSVNTSVLTS